LAGESGRRLFILSPAADIYNMCGIAGILSLNKNRHTIADIQSMNAALSHRGPDGESYWVNPEATVILGHRRLAIIDCTDSAMQPMHFKERYSIVHNGEIYNYLELAAELKSMGYQFRTKSDTEVILAAFDCFGEKCVEKFEGMFAFAIWDEQDKKLFAARDRFGEKPFYYIASGNDFYFASEPKAFRSIGLQASIDEQKMLLYLVLGQTESASEAPDTFYKNIRKLPPAHYLLIETTSRGLSPLVKPYWNLHKVPGTSTDIENTINRFKEIFEEAVLLRLRSDVSIGTSLSGGLDSSSIVATIHKLASHGPSYSHKAFTAAFPGFERDESKFARVIAEKYSLQHHFVYPSATVFADEIESLIRHHEEPIGSASVYAQYKVYELAKQKGIKVLLDGQGADEILAGYSRYIHWYLQELLAKAKFSRFSREKKLLKQHGPGFDWQPENYAAAISPMLTRKIIEQRAEKKFKNNTAINGEFLRAYYSKEAISKPLIRSLADILHYTTVSMGLGELLRYADSNSMAHGCEVRLPFLQYRLVEFIFTLPSFYKINDGYTKWILRKSMEKDLPASITWRIDKTGFEPPQQQWMNDPGLQERIKEAKQKLVNERILHSSVLTKKIQPHSAYAADNDDWRYLSAGVLLG
jgi:asparagine synthase (glutamine-hydrolysing)